LVYNSALYLALCCWSFLLHILAIWLVSYYFPINCFYLRISQNILIPIVVKKGATGFSSEKFHPDWCESFFNTFRFKITLTDHKIATHSSEARKTHYYLHKAILLAVKSDNTGHICKRNIVALPRKLVAMETKQCVFHYILELPLSLCKIFNP
jgi:hypothetical protein